MADRTNRFVAGRVRDVNIVKNIDSKKVNFERMSGSGHVSAKSEYVPRYFREDLMMYFGHQLPANVIDELCKLAQEHSQGKCMSCMLPTENIILNVLHILSDAAQLINGSKENIDPNVIIKHADISHNAIGNVLHKHCSHKSVTASDQRVMQPINQQASNRNVSEKFILTPKLPNPGVQSQSGNKIKDNSNLDSCTSARKGSNCSTYFDSHKYCTQKAFKGFGQGILEPTTSTSFKIQHSQENTASRETFGLFNATHRTKPPFALDTQVVMQQGDRHSPLSLQIGSCTKTSLIDLNANVEDVADDEVCVVQGKAIVDDLYNKRNLKKKRALPVIDLTIEDAENKVVVRSTERFPITDKEKSLYDVICGLAYSQWKCEKAVEFSLTSLTYNSLGQSVEPRGLADNFFMSAICRKFFEQVHPKRSKRHFFYPKIGGCLYTYGSSYDVNTVKKSFLGANSAYKLHLSHKLCFPIVLEKHWFVFIVDLEIKSYVFLDSLFGVNDKFQIDARSKLMNAFKECWYEYAEVKTDVDVFSVVYPPVPKQENAFDCGIFAVKFMELWDESVDLSCLFQQSDIPNLRVKIALDLYFSKENCIDKSTVLNLYQQGINPHGLY